MINLCAVGIIGKTQLEATRIEVLIHTCGIQPFVANTTREIKVEVLHAEMIGFVVELAAEFLLAQLTECRYSISNVARLDSTLRWSHQISTLERCITAPMGRELMHRRRIYSR